MTLEQRVQAALTQDRFRAWLEAHAPTAVVGEGGAYDAEASPEARFAAAQLPEFAPVLSIGNDVWLTGAGGRTEIVALERDGWWYDFASGVDGMAGSVTAAAALELPEQVAP